jgi:hypothetical protein
MFARDAVARRRVADKRVSERSLLDMAQPSARIDHIVGDIYRIATWVPAAGITFSQFLIDDERPAPVHTGMHELYRGGAMPWLRCSIPRASSSSHFCISRPTSAVG